MAIEATTYREVKGWADEEFGRTSPDEAAYFRAELKRGGVNLTQPLEVLEFGFGNGSFAGWCGRQGWNWTGVEVDPELVSRAAKFGLRAASTRPTTKTDSFDLVVGFDVFEHMTIEEIKAVLQYSRDCLRPGGKIIGRIPSGDSPFVGWIYNGDVTHRLLLGTSAVRQLASEAGLSVVDVREPSLPLLGVGIVRAIRRIVVRVTQGLISTLVRIAYHGGQRTVVTPNLLFILQRRESSHTSAPTATM